MMKPVTVTTITTKLLQGQLSWLIPDSSSGRNGEMWLLTHDALRQLQSDAALHCRYSSAPQSGHLYVVHRHHFEEAR